MPLETDTTKIVKRLLRDGWYLHRNGGNHDIYRHAEKKVIQVPRHRVVSPGVARNIAKAAGWL